jgi:hypothetical protein
MPGEIEWLPRQAVARRPNRGPAFRTAERVAAADEAVWLDAARGRGMGWWFFEICDERDPSIRLYGRRMKFPWASMGKAAFNNIWRSLPAQEHDFSQEEK